MLGAYTVPRGWRLHTADQNLSLCSRNLNFKFSAKYMDLAGKNSQISTNSPAAGSVILKIVTFSIVNFHKKNASIEISNLLRAQISS